MAVRYWVGGTGTWDTTSTANWSATSGGAPGASAPTSADSANIDANSGAGVITLGANITLVSSSHAGYTGTIDFANFKISLVATTTATVFTGSTAVTYTGNPTIELSAAASGVTRTINCVSFTEANSINLLVTAGTDTVNPLGNYRSIDLTGFSGTYSTQGRILYGNLTIPSTVTLPAGTASTTFAATSGTQQITTNGKTLDFPLIQNGVGGTVQLQDNLTMGSTRTFTLTNGALDLNNLTLSTGLFNSNNSNTRSIAFGTGKIIVSGGGGSLGYWDVRTATNFTYTGTSNVEFTYSGATATRIIRHGDTAGASASNAINIAVVAGTDSFSITANGHFLSIDYTGFGGVSSQSVNMYGNLTLSATQTTTSATAATTFAGTSGTQQITTNGVTVNSPLTFNGIGGTFAFQDALTQLSTRAFTITNGTIQLKNGVTSTVGAFATSGTNQKFLRSTLAGSQATLSQASGTVNASYLTIQDVNATGGAIWNARTDLGSKDISNNTGWNFIYIAVQQILKPIMAKILQPIILN
jgi:hypothetical protein